MFYDLKMGKFNGKKMVKLFILYELVWNSVAFLFSKLFVVVLKIKTKQEK